MEPFSVRAMVAFSVRLETRAPRDEGGVTSPYDYDAAADELMDRLEDYDGIVTVGPRSWDATVTISAGGPREAADEGVRIIEQWAIKTGMPLWPPVRIEALRQDILGEELERSSLPDLVSAAEAADILGVTPQRVHQLAVEHEGFPVAAYELRVGRLWLRAAIEAFAKRKRRPGRPPRT
jgi:hypothetical protein